MSKSANYTVRYEINDEHKQELLRLALFEAWEGRCSVCTHAIPDATYAQIDHVLPRTKFDSLTSELNDLDAAAYSPDAVAHLRALPADVDSVLNLAPICSSGRDCNARKSNSIKGREFSAILYTLKKAAEKARKVDSRVNSMLEAQGLEANLVSLVALPDEEDVSRLIDEYGPSVAKSLWRFNPLSLSFLHPSSEMSLEVDAGEVPDWLTFPDINLLVGVHESINLTTSEKMTLTGARVVFGVDAIKEVSDAISELVLRIDKQVESDLDEVNNATVIGPRTLKVDKHQVASGVEPVFKVELVMEVTIGGDAENGTDNDGTSIFEKRAIRADSVLTCQVNLVSGKVSKEERTQTSDVSDLY